MHARVRDFLRNWGVIGALILGFVIAVVAQYAVGIWHATVALDVAGDAWLEKNGWFYHAQLAVLAIIMLGFAGMHFINPQSGYVANYLFLVLLVGVTAYLGYLLWDANKANVFELLAAAFVFGVGTFVFGCELLIMGLARVLTNRYQDKWTKKIEYLYLGASGCGLVLAIGKIATHDGWTRLNSLGIVILIAALALRFIKTRAEIAEWNK